MIRVRQIKVLIEDDNRLNEKLAKLLHISPFDILDKKIQKKSIDARKKPNLYYVYEVDVSLKNEDKVLKRCRSKDVFKAPDEKYYFPKSGSLKLSSRPIIVGSGPAGLFCAYFLAEKGFRPLIIERGDMIDERVEKVHNFLEKGILDCNSNIQFGEGGAGTFSDGKLNTLIKDKVFRQKKIFEIFVENGAPCEILYDSKPHIGTDLLRNVVKNMRNKIIRMGGEFRFRTCLTDIFYQKNKLVGIEVNEKEMIKTDILILAIGHSARDTFSMLYDKNIGMQAKPFAVGVRIIHPQELINRSQYGKYYSEKLGAASYKLTYTTRNRRGVYTFCMCPGGYVVNASSEKEGTVINGMSDYKRDSNSANSAIIVTVGPRDFGDGVFAGVLFQQNLERMTYAIKDGLIPVQLYQDFKNDKLTKEFGNFMPAIQGKWQFANLREVLPCYIVDSLIEGIDHFDCKIKGFGGKNAVLAGVETRTSSPIKLLRDETLQSNILGLYPCGEGAGYAGGITSAAVDGVKVAEEIIKTYKA